MVRRFLGFSAMEWVIIALGAGAVLLIRYSLPLTWWRVSIAGFALAFTWEASMEPLFTYHPQLKQRHCVGNSDVNFLFPLGWLMIAALTILIAGRLSSLPVVLAFVVGGLVGGNVMELTFHRCRFWTYNYNAAFIGRWKPLLPKLPIAGIPLQVILGYGLMGLMVYFLVHILF